MNARYVHWRELQALSIAGVEMVERESSESFLARKKEAERFVSSTRGPRPEPTEVKDAILAGTAGYALAMLTLALAGVGGERFDNTSPVVALIAAASVYLCRRLQQRAWQRAWMIRMSQTSPDKGLAFDRLYVETDDMV